MPLRPIDPIRPVAHAGEIMEFSQGKEQVIAVIFFCLVMEKGEHPLGILVKGFEQVKANQDITGKPAVVVRSDGADIDLGKGLARVVLLYSHRGATGKTEGDDEEQEKGCLPI